ncbi:neuronal acetylcholine receptor subunit alpha-4-like [Macrobrachium rosenbergii]|uniref:neuronal acetylcholine receptor subunit alpha-4-like n=1 Tax=Macrobrachium rosenbergii TaxID=79674 RepID=UPI0034D433A0
MRKLISFLSCLMLLANLVRSDDKHARVEEALRRTLMDGYDKYALPDGFTNISFTGLDIRAFTLDESNHMMDMEVWLKYTWDDPRLVWKPEDHLNISYLSMGPDTVWKPDLSIYNAHGAKDIAKHSKVLLLAYPNGKLLHVPWYNLRFTCVMDLTYWPQDVHNCTLIIGSWVHNGFIIDLVLDNYKVTVPGEDENSDFTNATYSEFTIIDWSVEKLFKYYECCAEPYPSIWTSFIVTRNAPAYTWTVKLPVVCMCLLTLVLFMLHPTSGEKVTFGGICLVLNFLLLYYITNKIGSFAFNTPLIVQLLGVQLVLVMACLFLSAFVVRMAKGPHVYGLPGIFRKSVASLARALFLGNFVDPKLSKSEDLEGGTGKVSPHTKSENSSLCEWVMLSAVVDRLSLIVYLAICIVVLVRFNSVL